MKGRLFMWVFLEGGSAKRGLFIRGIGVCLSIITPVYKQNAIIIFLLYLVSRNKGFQFLT